MSVKEFQLMTLRQYNFETVDGNRAPPAIHKDPRPKDERLLSTLPPMANPADQEADPAKLKPKENEHPARGRKASSKPRINLRRRLGVVSRSNRKIVEAKHISLTTRAASKGSDRPTTTKLSPLTPSNRTKMKQRQALVSSASARRRSIPPDALSFIVQGLDRWWKDYLSCLNRFLQSASGRNVHDIRVAMRRLSTVFDLVDRFNPDNMVRLARAKLKDQLSALSSLRDAHVEMVRMRGFLKELPELKPFYDELLDRETEALKAAKKIRWKSNRKFIETSFNRAMLRLNARRTTSSGESTRRIIEASIDVMFDNLSRKLEKVTPTDYASIHRVRLAFKPLRYTLELLQPPLGLDQKQIRTAAALAKVMGRIQDLYVLMKDLVEFNWRNEKVLASVVEIWLSLERQKAEATQGFFRAIPKFGNIWKPIIQGQAKAASSQSQILFILRHGIAVTRGDPAYPLDSDRPLTSKGMKRMRRIANGMRRMGVRFNVILSSPYRRALETSFVVGREYGAGQAIQTNDALKPEVLPEEVIRTLQEKYSTCRRMLLVGHEPQLSALVSTLTSGSGSARPLLKKGGLCKLQANSLQIGKCAALLWLLTPKQLMNIA